MKRRVGRKKWQRESRWVRRDTGCSAEDGLWAWYAEWWSSPGAPVIESGYICTYRVFPGDREMNLGGNTSVSSLGGRRLFILLYFSECQMSMKDIWRVSSEELGVRSGGRRAPRIALMPMGVKWCDSFLYSSPRWYSENDRVVFHLKRYSKGYCSADFFCETFPVIASAKVIKVIQGYEKYRFRITLYTPFNLIDCDNKKNFPKS